MPAHYADGVPNRLIDSSSAYLRQHAHNPVDWFPWGPEAFDRALELDRPIFLSIGYAACHWCHVMAHESFEDPEIARRLNENFVAVKVDREERPDVDAIYMAATIAVSGHGGWPMSVFLMPDGHAFMAGTYFPPTDRHGQPSFGRLLDAMASAWMTQRSAVYEQAEKIRAASAGELSVIDRLSPQLPDRSFEEIDAALAAELIARCDDDGGFGPEPKFPRSSYVEALLRHFHEPDARAAATRTLEAMSRRGLYDHIGGGFARYSVDRRWIVPHFEKMLYDQAQLATCYLRADRAAGGGSPWREVALGTIEFVLRELAVNDGLASSLDADSGGTEGAHVVWTPGEVAHVLRDAGLTDVIDAALRRWSITDEGNFEGMSIPVLGDDEPFVAPAELAEAQEALRRARSTRVQPGRDEKVVLEWNAMFLVAMFESADVELITEGCRRLSGLHTTHFADGSWWRTESRSARAIAADLAWLVEAHVACFEATGDDSALAPVPSIVAYLMDHYWEGERPVAGDPGDSGGLFTSSDEANDLVLRPKEIFDAATPSAHAVFAGSLARYSMITGDADAAATAERLLALAGPLIEDHPGAVPELVRALGFVASGREIVVPGPPNELSALVRGTFLANSVLVTGSGSSPLLAGRAVGSAYVCHRGVCDLPATSPADLRSQLAAGS